jgi:hypothetical protein
MEKPERKPGDFILDRYMPNATSVQREEARENLYAVFSVLLRIATRRAEDGEAIRGNGSPNLECDSGYSPDV